MRSQLNAVMEPAIEDMRREVAFVLMRLPSRVKSMRMSDFLRECGGDVALLADVTRRRCSPTLLADVARRRCAPTLRADDTSPAAATRAWS